MGLKGLLLPALLCLVAYGWWRVNLTPEMPEIDVDKWWGPIDLRTKQDTSIRPFKIQFDEKMVDDLKRRLGSWRAPAAPLQDVGFAYGFNTSYLARVVSYWRDEYDFAQRETFLNRFPHFKTNVQGLDIHFIRVKPKNPGNRAVLPLLLLHGWPGSVREFYEMIPLLTTPVEGKDFVFEVIAPSLPGYGFSDSAVVPGLGTFETAIIMRNLMHRLGYAKYYIQGGDWGATICSIIATIFPEETLGFHSNLLVLGSLSAQTKTLLGSMLPSVVVESEYANRVYPYWEKFAFMLEEMGYMHLQATKPDTVGVSLSDSPAGLAAYILEKFSTWTNPTWRTEADGGLTKKFTLDQLLDNVMMYWTSNSITTSMRMYAESFNKRALAMGLDDIPTGVPTWGLKSRHELAYTPDSILRGKYTNLLGTTHIDDGGHFLAFEMPRTVADDVIMAVAKFREFHSKK